MRSPLTLADRVLTERAEVRQMEPLRGDVAPLLRQTPDKYVFDTAASAMIGTLGSQPSRGLARLVPLAVPPTETIWIEWDHRALRQAGIATGVVELDGSDAEWVLRMGALVKRVRHGDSDEITATGFTFVGENEPAHAVVSVMYWPIAYLVGVELRQGMEYLGLGDWLDDERAVSIDRAIWGIGGLGDPKPLQGLGMCVMTDGADTLRRIDRKVVDEAIKQAMFDLTGALRYAVAALAVINAVGEVGASHRPPGMIRAGGSMRPYQPHRLVTVNVPKHRQPLSFARSRIAAVHHRLHEVRAHWRRLTHEPRASGWAAVEINGRTYWQKAIARHLRGDPDLGVVEHAGALVRGERAL